MDRIMEINRFISQLMDKIQITLGKLLIWILQKANQIQLNRAKTQINNIEEMVTQDLLAASYKIIIINNLEL